MGIYKPLNYDATMLIRLTTEMKDAFLLEGSWRCTK